jgi:TonB family protein
VYLPGGSVSPPKVISATDPGYSEEARGAELQGNMVLRLVVNVDGRPQQIRVQRSLGMGLDEKAIESVSQWTFEPAKKDGQPVPAMIKVSLGFHLGKPLNAVSYKAIFAGVDKVKYPLMVQVISSDTQQKGAGRIIKAKVRISESWHEHNISCRTEDGPCSPFGPGYYPARWNNGQLEMLSLNFDGNWEASELTVARK